MDFKLDNKSILYRPILSYTLSYLCSVSEKQKHPPVRREDLWVRCLHHLPDNSQDEMGHLKKIKTNFFMLYDDDDNRYITKYNQHTSREYLDNIY